MERYGWQHGQSGILGDRECADVPLTVRDLVSLADLDLRLWSPRAEADPEQLERAITWVHVSELRDPTPFLSGGELLLTTGLAFDRPDVAVQDARDYVRRLADAAVVGLGFGTGLSHAQIPSEIIEAGRELGLPIVEVPRGTPFIAISRAVSNALAADEYASVTRTFTAQQALTKAAMADAGPQRVVRLLARQLDAWVALVDRSGTVIAGDPESPQARIKALASEIATLVGHRGPVSSGFPLGADIVSMQSVGADSRGRAFLAVGRTTALTADDRHLVNAAVMLLTLRLEQPAGLEEGLEQLRSVLVQLMLSGQSRQARSIADRVDAPLPDAPFCVLAVTGNYDLARAVDEELPATAGRHLTAVVDGTVLIVVGAGAAAEAAVLVSRIGPGSAVGISEPRNDAEFESAHRQALQAADFGRRHRRGVTSFEEIAMPGISALILAGEGAAFADSLLRPLIEHDLTGRGDLVNSLCTWLSHHGQWEPSATALGVHRHTLRQRISAAGELLGRDLDAPGVRAEVWLALELLGRSPAVRR